MTIPKLFLKILITFSFCQGLLFYIGFNTPIYKSVVIFLTLTLSVFLLFHKTKKLQLDILLILFLLYSKVTFISSYFNVSDIKDIVSFLTFILPAIIVYLFIRKVRYDEAQIIKINNLLFNIFIFQIFASFIKLIFWGRTEAVVGTIHYSGGSLNTIVPLIGIAMLIAFYLFYKNSPTYLMLILGFLFMGWVGEKRGIYFYLIILTAFAYYFNIIINKNLSIVKMFRQVVTFSTLVLVVFYFGVKYNYTLNPEYIIGGTFNLEHVYKYAYDYSTFIDADGYSSGRFSGIIAVFNSMLDKQPINKLIGFGPSELIGATHLDYKQYSFGVSRLMAINGWSNALISIGFIGAIVTVIFYLNISIFVYRFTKVETISYWKAISFGTFLITIVFFLDFFTYTRSFYHSIPLNITLLYLYAILKDRKEAKFNIPKSIAM